MKGAVLLRLIATVAAYDYVVVGSGPGGGTLATELAMKGFDTLLIEAGPDHYGDTQAIPAFQANASEDPATSFEFDAKHYNNNKTYFYPRAGVLGGCAVHNAMIAIYPNTRDFELMREITGDSGWSEGAMRTYFKRMEGNQYLNRTRNHGFNGWLKTSLLDFDVLPTLDPFLANYTSAVVGNPLYDVNGLSKAGPNADLEAKVFIPQTIDRPTFSRANFPKYIREVAKQYPLTIWTDTFVTRVLFRGKSAVGVEYKKGKYLYGASPLSSETSRRGATRGTVMAKEVILSGGTFNTPQLLMLSGVGDRRHLAELDIPVVSHVPGVGRNMMDRYEVPVGLQYPKRYSQKGCKFTPTYGDPCYREYTANRTGLYTFNGILSGELKKSAPSLGEPDLFILNFLFDFHGYFRGYSKEIAGNLDVATKLILKAHTSNSNGTVSLVSRDPFAVPAINFHYFSDGDRDLDILVQAVKSERAALKKVLVPHRDRYPGKSIRTDEQIRQYIKDNAWGHHACCTAKMGTVDDPLAVVDAKFRVRGVKNLRVVDMSIFPRIPGYFPQVYIHMMAMKAADDITA